MGLNSGKYDSRKMKQNFLKRFLVPKILKFVLSGFLYLMFLGFAGYAIAAPLVNGGSVSGVIETSAEIDTYTFTGEVGDHVDLQLADIDNSGTFTARFELYGPSGGDYLKADTQYQVARITHTLTEGGTYTVLVKNSFETNSTENYNLYFVSIPGANEHGLLVNDGVHSGAIDAGDLDTYTFKGEVGDHVDLQLVDIDSSGTFTALFELYGPSGGDYLKADVKYDVARITHTLTEEGTYTVLVKNSFPTISTENYNLYFVSIPGANEHGLLVNNGVYSGVIDAGDLDTYTFIGHTDDHVNLQLANTDSSGTFAAGIELYGPSGGDYLAVNSSYTIASVAYTLTNNGIYTVLLKNGLNAVSTEDYELSFSTTGQAGRDMDGDGLSDLTEYYGCTDINDADSDDDGIPDGVEDADHNGVVASGETDPCDSDTDGDGIQDGTELGYILNDIGNGTNLNIFIPDADTSTTTNPLSDDTDGDGIKDGIEDPNHNGRVDPGEKDPNAADERYAVNTSAPINQGNFTPSSQIINHGDTATFDVNAKSGYRIDTVTGCNGTWTGSNPYTTGSITADCTVTAVFNKFPWILFHHLCIDSPNESTK